MLVMTAAGTCVLVVLVLVELSWVTGVHAALEGYSHSLVTERGPLELCETEEFKPTCNPDQVVMITHATYGRMKIGRCVKTDYGYVGCSSSVINHLHKMCSGQKDCTVPVPDPVMDETKPCPAEFKTYLNVSYNCIQVESEACTMCTETNMFARVNLSEAYISSVVTAQDKFGCGTSRCPWLIEVRPGQKINVTMYDFGVSQHDGGCARYAWIKEEAAPGDTQVCSGRHRVSHVYSSISNSLEIHIMSPEVFQTRGHFLLHYQAVGCPDLPPPTNTNVRREDDKLIVGCQSLNTEWELHCVGTHWEGEMGECPGRSECT